MTTNVPVLTADLAQRLRGVLAAASFTEERVTELLGVSEMTAVVSQAAPLLLYRTKGGSQLETLVRLFVLNEPVPVNAAAKALWPTTLEEWLAARLISRGDGSVASSVRLFPIRDLLLMWDLPSYTEEDRVMGVAPSSLSLVGMTIRRPSSATLDLGSGCGVQALLAASHSEHVAAIDRNPRAAAFAEQNALLNRVTNIENLVGDRFEPARGRRFDLIVSCPPYAISPGVRILYRDGGEAGDGFCRKVIQEAPALLNEGGYCQLLCEWAHIEGEDVRARLASWLEGSGCDALILRAGTRDVPSHVAFWRSQKAQTRGEEDHSFEEWSSYMEAARIEAVSFGFITMRRRSGAENWLRFEDAPRFIGQCGDAVLGEFERRDFLEATQDDGELINRRLRASPDLMMSQDLSLSAEGWAVTGARVRLTRGFAREGNVNMHLAALIERFYEPRRIRDVVNELAAGLGQDPASIREGCLEAIRGLVEEGMLLPAQEP